MLSAFPPLHRVDGSVDVGLCADVLDSLGITSFDVKEAIIRVTVLQRRDHILVHAP